MNLDRLDEIRQQMRWTIFILDVCCSFVAAPNFGSYTNEFVGHLVLIIKHINDQNFGQAPRVDG